MTAPQFPAAWGQTPAPAPAQVPGYPPQTPPAQPGYGQYPTPPQQMPQQFAQPPAPAYPPAPYGAPQGYPMPGQQMTPYDPYAAAQPPAFTPAGGTLDEYLGQRPVGAAFWKWAQPGSVCIGMVERDLRDSDVTQVTFQGRPVQRRDGSISQEKSINIPLVNQDGSKAIWEVKGADRTVLTEAVRAQGGPENGLPEGGSMLRVTHTHTEPSRGGGSPRKVKTVEYVPAAQVQGQGQLPQQPAPAQAAPQQPNPAIAQYVQQGAAGDPAYQAWLAQQQNQPAPQQAAPAQQFAAPPAAAGHPQAQPAPASSPTPDMQYASPVPGPQQYAQPPMQAPGAQPQQASAPQPYAAPGMDPAAAQMFGNLLGGAPTQQ